MNSDVSWAEYVKAVVGDDSGRRTARLVGQSESAVSRWKSGAFIPDPRQAVTFARAYKRNPIEALIAAGYLTEEEAALPLESPPALQLHEFSDIELARELVRRADDPEEQHELLGRELTDDNPVMRPDDE